MKTALDYAKMGAAALMDKFTVETLPPVKRFHYHQGVFLAGVERVYKLTGDETYKNYIKAWVDLHIDEEGNAPYCADTIFDDVQPALLLFDLYRETGDERYKIVMDRSFRNVEMWPTNAKGGVWHMKFRDNQMWLDTMYMMGVFSARYAKAFDNPYMFEKIHKQMKLMRTYVTDLESGLLYHMWDDSKVEYLNRGTVAIKIDNGVFLSWRLLGTEPTDTTFDIYKNGELLLGNHTNTNYTDADGSEDDVYQVVVSGKSIENEKKTTVMSKDYMDIPISKPIPDVAGNVLAGSDYTYSANDATVADLDGDGEYEYILKWDPSNSQDNYYSGHTGNVYIDAYETDGTLMWRIDLGVNIRAGAHYTQFIAYDFDSDGKAEVAMRTAPGSKDAAGTYVTEVGVNLTEGDNTKDYRNTDGRITTAPDYLTMFNGETGAAMQTVDYYVQRGDLGASSGWAAVQQIMAATVNVTLQVLHTLTV